MALGHFAHRVWSELGAQQGLLNHVGDPDPAVVLPSRLDVAGLVSDSIGVSALAIELAAAARTGRTVGRIGLRGDRIVTSVQSERHFRRDGQPPLAWAPLSGFWQAGDGWVRTHANYPHHERRLRRLLGLDDRADTEAFAAVVAERNTAELEKDAAACGAIVVAVRDPKSWKSHPQAQALAHIPMIGRDTAGRGAARRWPTADELPLSGVRVLDLTRVIAGPVATRDLAYAGADVLRIDSPRLPEIDWQHLDTGQGKRTATMDFDDPSDRSTLEELLVQTDVVVTGYRPGSLARYGLSPDELADRFPGIVIGTVSAWGATGPWRLRRGFDSIVQAATGIAMRESPDGSRPGALPAQALDHSAGHFLAAAITHSLCHQRAEGGSVHVSVALARVAQELLDGPPVDGVHHVDIGTVPTLDNACTPSGILRFAAPAVTYPGGPETYSFSGTPWGANRAQWCERP
ncbi:MAG: CoA transferase [Mycobacterium sp.]|nr:CoA transferase [Mycobacterium sp.]